MVLVSYALKNIIVFYKLNSAIERGTKPDAVWSKNSCGFAFVVFQEAPKPFATSDRAFMCCVLADRRKEYHVTLALMISLVMINLLYLSA